MSIKKDKVVRARVTDEKLQALKGYCEEHNTTASKLIDDFLSELLKDRLKKDWFLSKRSWLRESYQQSLNHKVKFPLRTLNRVKWIITDTS